MLTYIVSQAAYAALAALRVTDRAGVQYVGSNASNTSSQVYTTGLCVTCIYRNLSNMYSYLISLATETKDKAYGRPIYSAMLQSEPTVD